MDWSRRNFLRKTGLAGAGAAVGGVSTLLDGCAISQNYDLWITGGHVIDGTGAPPLKADIGIVGERIVNIGPVRGFSKKTSAISIPSQKLFILLFIRMGND